MEALPGQAVYINHAAVYNATRQLKTAFQNAIWKWQDERGIAHKYMKRDELGDWM
jgi:hypothetical protein